MTSPLLTRPPVDDPRHLRYPIRAVTPPQTPRRIIHTAGPVLNQGRTSLCLSHAWAGILLTGSNATTEQGNRFARRISAEACAPYDWCVDSGLIDAYHWARSLNELRDGILAHGPAVVSVPWFPSMRSQFTRRNRVKVKPTVNYGWHAVMLHGYDPAYETRAGKTVEAFLIRNSWGTSWGDRGDAWITARHLHQLLTWPPLNYSNTAAIAIGRKTFDVRDYI